MNKKVGLIGGSGLDDPKILKNAKEAAMYTPYGAPASPLAVGQIAGCDVVVLARHGRGHAIAPTQVPWRANIWALKEIGCTHILATTACGSLKEEIKPKEFVILDQFIDFTKSRKLTFFDDKVVHTAMADPFCPSLRKLLVSEAGKLKIPCHERGTAVTIEGPRFSTRAESFMFQKWGADIINMTSVPEASLAKELGMCYAAVAMVTDYDCWREGEAAVTFELVLKTMKHNAKQIKALLLSAIPKITRCRNCELRA